ncbi:MAG: TPM domain-containing protein [Clostridia bacterium]|nr:TPM domain-containing protein [Clostridia bacterium]
MKKLFALTIALLIAVLCSVTVFAESASPRFIDGGELLDADEEAAILAKLDSLSTEYDYDIVIITAEALGEKSAYQYANDAYIEGGYGMGEDGESGVILIVSMTEREWYIEFFGEERVTEGTALSEYFLDQLSGGDYYGAFDSFAEAVGDQLAFPLGTLIIIALVIGFIVALIATSVMKGKLKSVAMQNNAREYVRQGSFKLTHSRDLFLYSQVTRVARPKNTSSGGSRSGGGGGSRGGGGSF